MSAVLQPAPSNARPRLYAELAVSPDDVREAQRLRYQVFAEELGARLKSASRAIDEDRFDPYCAHLLVREGNGGRVVGCTRLLADEQAAAAGGFYSEGEFDIAPILALPGKRLEMGRTCIAAEHRQGAAIAVLWSGIAGLVALHGYDYLFGCASIELNDGGYRAQAIVNRLRQQAMSDDGLRVRPLLPLPPAAGADAPLAAAIPPLLKAYVRAGAKVCGEPCWDPDFNVADLLMLLDFDDLDPTYARHFLARAGRNGV